MNTQQQYQTATVIAAMLGIIGMVTIGIAFGLAIGVQTLLGVGCPPPSIAATEPCQIGMQNLKTRATYGSVAGVASLMIGGGMVYYLRQHTP